MSIAGQRMAAAVRSAAVTGLGIVLALVPPALWVAWTEAMLLMVVLVAVASAGLLVALADHGPEAEDCRGRRLARHGDASTDEAVAELHRIFPLTYHHSLIGRARFRRAMRKVQRLIGSNAHGADERP